MIYEINHTNENGIAAGRTKSLEIHVLVGDSVIISKCQQQKIRMKAKFSRSKLFIHKPQIFSSYIKYNYLEGSLLFSFLPSFFEKKSCSETQTVLNT